MIIRSRAQRQQAAYTDQDVQRWKRRMTLRWPLNGSPLPVDTERQHSECQQQPLPACHFDADVQVAAASQNLGDHVTPLSAMIFPLHSTPGQQLSTPMPNDVPVDWNCCESMRGSNLLSDSVVSASARKQTEAFYQSSFKDLFGQLFDSLLKDERTI